jgi:transposase
VALGAAGKVLVRKKFTQRQLLAYTTNMQPSLIGLEDGSGAHFLGRVLRKQGHDVRLIAAQFVKPFVKSNKSDFVDAEAIAEAVERKNMRFVPIKTDDQLDPQAIHRVRDRQISRRTAVINQLRAFLLEPRLVFAKTPATLRAAMPDILENPEADLTPQMRNLVDLLWGEWKTIEQQIEVLSLELERISAADAGCTRIRQIPGIGPIVATAIVAAIGNGAAFHKGREVGAWLGLVPRQYSTGGKAKLLGISKRGNVYLRKILIHGARSSCASHPARSIADRRLDGCTRCQSSQERRRGRYGQQACTDRLGCIVERRKLQVYRQRLISIKGRIHLRRLVSSPFRFPLQSCGGPYIPGTDPRGAHLDLLPDRPLVHNRRIWLLADVLFRVIVVISCAGRAHFC